MIDQLLSRRNRFKARGQAAPRRLRLPALKGDWPALQVRSLWFLLCVAPLGALTAALDRPLSVVSMDGEFQRVASTEIEQAVAPYLKAGFMSANLDAIQRAIEAYRTRDISICDLVDHGEQAIDRFEREVDQMALDLLAMEQPMAIDLRFILAVIKINADLERVGDAANSISDRVRDLEAFPVVDLPVDIPRMASLAAGMVRKSLHAFIEGDADLAESVLLLDDDVDRLNDGAFFALSSLMKSQPELTPQALNALMIARSLERVADHATNVAEDVIFWVRGRDVRHHVGRPADSTPAAD